MPRWFIHYIIFIFAFTSMGYWAFLVVPAAIIIATVVQGGVIDLLDELEEKNRDIPS